MARFAAFASDSEDETSATDTSSHTDLPKTGNGKPQPIYASSSASDESVNDELYATDEDDESDSIVDEGARNAAEHEEPVEGESTPWAKHLNLEPHRVHLMQSSLFRVPELTKTQASDSFVFLSHKRSSDVHGEPKPARTRASFSQPHSQPPPRKYVRVTASESVSANQEGLYLDAGLSMGRSFRVGWGPGNKLVHVGDIINRTSSSQSATSSIVRVTSIRIATPETPDLLQHLLSHSVIASPSPDNEDTPYATPNPDVTFSSFSSLFTAQDRSHCASVFRLGHALFDPLDLHLREDISDDIRDRVLALRRADALSAWLGRAVSSSVEEAVKATASTDSAVVAFLYLTGNQVEKAVEVLMNNRNVRLATVISQAPGDAEFRADVREQLRIWKEEKVDVFMSESVRKLYALAAGEVDVLEGSSRKENIDIPKGLDWMRVLGLQLWYSASLDTPLRETFEVYEQLVQAADGRIGFPTPWYSKAPSSASSVKDGLFNLIKLSLSSSMTLESALEPLSFSSNPRDYRMPWFLYILLSRCLRTQDFTDRQLYDAMEDDMDATQEIEGYSQVANILTTNFAAQLQQDGLIQEAAYVLLFLEDDVGRKRAIRDLLFQSASLLDEFTTAGLCGSLRIPEEWVHEAKAAHAYYLGDVYGAYELYTCAKVHSTAHELAITYLAPEAILRDELDVLAKLFTSLDKSLIDDFGVGGQLFIDYVKIISRVPELREKRSTEGAVPDAAEASELEVLSARIPKLIGILPDVLHDKPGTGETCKAALTHMLSKLLECVDPSVPTKVEVQPGLVDEGARIRHIHASAYGSFMRTIAEMLVRASEERNGKTWLGNKKEVGRRDQMLNGPIYFKAVPCSSSCYKCPSALASSSRLQPGLHAESVSGEAGDFEWRRGSWEACASIQSLTATLDPSRPSRTTDKHRHHPLPSSSFASLSDPARSRQVRLASRSADYDAAEMTPVSHSRNARSANIPNPGRITERLRSSQIATSSAELPDASPRSEPFSRSASFKRTGDHGYATRDRIWSWVAGIDRGHPPSLDYSASLQVPSDVGFERDLYSSPRPRTVASSLNTHLSAVTMSPPPSSGSSCSSPLSGRRITPFSSASYAPDRTTEELSAVWQLMMDEPSSFLASSPCPSSHSSTMGFASTLPREHTVPDEPVYRNILDRWAESAEWKGEEHPEGEESTSGIDADYSFDIYPRSATSSPLTSDAEMHPDVLPALLDQQDFSSLMLQSFTLALADAASEENEEFRRFSVTAEAEVEEDAMSILLCPTNLQDLDFDFMDQWSPPALRSSSSASSLDPFQLELFSPTSEQTDPAAVWEAHRTPGQLSESPEFFSSSPFVGWSTTSSAEIKPTLLTMPHKSAVEPFAGVPLYQPQPIRPIPPIEIPLNALV